MLRFVGVGSAFNTWLGNTSAFVRLDERLLLIDCGGSVFERLLERNVLKGITALEICITHTHGDHVGSLGDLVLYCHFILKIKPVLRYPESERIRTLLTIFGVPEEVYSLDGSLEFGLEENLRARFVLLEHADTMRSYGILATQGNRSFWYSGDSRQIPPEILDSFLAGQIELFYQDTSGADYPDSLHMSLERLKILIPQGLRHRVVCMHQDEAFNPMEAERLGFRIAKACKPL